MQSLKSEIVSSDRKTQVEEFKQEFVEYDSSFEGTMGMGETDSVDKWLGYLDIHKQKSTLPEGHVVTTGYFAVREEDDKIVGIFSVKHYLNDLFIRVGNGNVGYCVRPLERRKGYATKMLKMALEECSKLGMIDVRVSCHEDNIGSKKTIIKNGGVFLKNHIRKDGIRLEYTIKLQEKKD